MEAEQVVVEQPEKPALPAVAPPVAGVSVIPGESEYRVMAHMAEVLYKSGILPSHIKSWQAAFAVIQKGRELGVAPMLAFANMPVIDGKPTLQSELMLALIYRDHGGNAIRFRETTAERCVIAYRRRDWPAEEYDTFTLTMEDMKRVKRRGTALTDGDNWKSYPAAMLRARALSAVARIGFADTIGGLYTPEELGAAVQIRADGLPAYEEPPEPQAADDGRSAGAEAVSDADWWAEAEKSEKGQAAEPASAPSIPATANGTGSVKTGGMPADHPKRLLLRDVAAFAKETANPQRAVIERLGKDMQLPISYALKPADWPDDVCQRGIALLAEYRAPAGATPAEETELVGSDSGAF